MRLLNDAGVDQLVRVLTINRADAGRQRRWFYFINWSCGLNTGPKGAKEFDYGRCCSQSEQRRVPVAEWLMPLYLGARTASPILIGGILREVGRQVSPMRGICCPACNCYTCEPSNHINAFLCIANIPHLPHQFLVLRVACLQMRNYMEYMVYSSVDHV